MLEQVDPVADFEHVRVVVHDQDHRDVATRLQLSDQVEDQRALLRAHRRQRLVEKKDLRLRVDGACDRDRLALPSRKQRHLRVDVGDPDAHLVEVLACPPSHLGVVEHRQVDAPEILDELPLEEHVVVDGQAGDECQVLVDGVDPERSGLGDRADLHLVAVDEDLAAVRLVEAADDLDQVQRHVLERDDRAEPLRDVLDSDRVGLSDVALARFAHG